MNVELPELKRRLAEAAGARRQIENEKQSRHSDLEAKVRTHLNRIFGPRLEEANRLESETRQAVDAERERIALTGAGSKYALGTKLIEWESRCWGGPLRPTGRCGVVEAITSTSKHPLNLRYGRASIGEFVIRFLLKDGGRSLRYDRLDSAYGWHLEGMDPNKKGVAA
jgi:hypothetical protein